MKATPDKKQLPDLLKRLQQFMDHEGLSAYQINKEAGLAKGLITKAMSNCLGLTSGTLEALLLAYPQLNANWLIVGRGPMLLQDDDAAKKAQESQEHIQDLQHIQEQCVEIVKQIQLMKQRTAANADSQLLSELMK